MLWVHLERKAKKVTVGNEALKDIGVTRENQEEKEKRERKVRREMEDHKDHQDRPAKWDLKASKVKRVMMAHQESLDLRDRLAPRDQTEQLDQKENWVIMVLLVLKDLREKVLQFLLKFCSK